MTGPSSDARVLEATSYTLTVSGDPRFLPMVRALAARTAETAGASADESARLAAAVIAVLEALVAATASRAAADRLGTEILGPEIMQVRFDVGAEGLRVKMTCDPPVGARAGWTLERELAARGRLDDLRAAAPDVEIGASGAHHFCRFTCAVPRRS